MPQFASRRNAVPLFRTLLVSSAALVSMLGLSGCLVAGYSSNGGAFIWPGGLGLVVVILVVLFLLRRRR